MGYNGTDARRFRSGSPHPARLANLIRSAPVRAYFVVTRYLRELFARSVPCALFLTLLVACPEVPAKVRAASLNLCADSILLEIAAPDQIVSVSWLATDPELSNYAEQASRYPNNQGRIEDLVSLSPHYVFTGENTSAIDNALLSKLGYSVVRLKPDRDISDYENNLRLVGTLLKRERQAEDLIAALNKKLSRLAPSDTGIHRPEAMIFQANGYIPSITSLSAHLLNRAGLRYPEKAAANWPQGRFLSLEELIIERPTIVIMTSANQGNPSLAELYLNHPALSSLHETRQGAWQPRIVQLKERHFNCGSQFLAESVKVMANARTDYLTNE